MKAVAKSSGILVLCDFDGTVSTVDMGNEVLNRFTGEGWEEIDRAYCAGVIGSRVAYMQVAPIFKGTQSQMLEFVSNSGAIDPHFPAFYKFCKDKQVDLKIVSDGLDFYISAILKKHNLQDIEFFSNVVVFQNSDIISIKFPRMNDQCKKCGTCKNIVLKQLRSDYSRVIYVGNGYSDVCPAGDADLVFAKDVLYEKCRQNGTPCMHYDNFNDILVSLRQTII
ncbi:MAG TPA: MtnX-like HAD-IB family phosphatase [Syntrophales bacterium]|nr:MtnX-like HAD-IB family phosphatase [Syntrophales bacterium]